MSEEQLAPIPNPPVRCAYKSLAAPRDLKPHPANPNQHPPKQIELFQAILGYTGWRRPITVSTRSGFVTKGHGALLAALAAGWSEVPVDEQEYTSEAEELADLVADNQLQRMSEMDTGRLQAVLVDLKGKEFDMKLTGFEGRMLTKLLAIEPPPPPPPPTTNGGLGGETGAPPPAHGTPPEGSAPPVHMVQLFLAGGAKEEFERYVAFFQKELGTANATETILHVLRSAFEAHTEDDGGEAAEPPAEAAAQ